MSVVIGTFWALAGAAVGSFVNVCIDRLPARQSLLSPASHCPACQRRLSALELIPVLSYVALRGRCGTCGVRIPARVLAVEALTAFVFALAYARFGASVQTLSTSLYASILIAVAFIDLEHKLVLNRLSYPAILLAAVAAPLSPTHTLVAMIAGGLVGFGALFVIAAAHREGMGMGDVKLAAFIGLAVGFPEILPTLMFAFVTGGLVAVVLLASGRVRRKDPIAFGPFLALAAILALLYGGLFTHWWLGRI